MLSFLKNSPLFIQIGFVLLGFFASFQLLLQVFRPDISPISGFVSEYGRGNYSWMFNLSLISLAFSILILAWNLPNQRNFTASKITITLSAISTVLVTLFPIDTDQNLTTIGLLHGISAGLTFGITLIYFGCLALAFRTSKQRRFTTAVFWMNVAGFLVFILSFPTPIKGLGERFYLVTISLGLLYYFLNFKKLTAIFFLP